MELEELPIFDQLAELPNRSYSYVVIAAVAGPITLRLFGFKTFAQLIRPLALLILLSGMYAKQQRAQTAGAPR
jgi:hypothetical protein